MREECEPQKTKADRDSHGRFLKGHSIKSKGRPPALDEQSYAAAFKAGCEPERFARIVLQVVAKAEEGIEWACKLLFKHALPVQVVWQEVGQEELRIAGPDGRRLWAESMMGICTKILGQPAQGNGHPPIPPRRHPSRPELQEMLEAAEQAAIEAAEQANTLVDSQGEAESDPSEKEVSDGEDPNNGNGGPRRFGGYRLD